ncbi:mushroom body large-type Kenyon cell-specific protein 1-like [Anopheles aquasalis]|uniref:mushroom body large-type Kenyon cell-specific protein 1-like n=1 Tax=Anopheles aquasalis TaxID=42839 RepID=UPI00215ADB4C|nr:mushroom body large-type Kenyon cell-specific protein 1-like [Anopheles aquasalis]
MAEAQRLIGISLAKIAQARVCRGGVSLHKNLLVATVLQKARYIFMEEAYHIVHGHYLQQQQQQQQQHHYQQQQQQQQQSAVSYQSQIPTLGSEEDEADGDGKKVQEDSSSAAATVAASVSTESARQEDSAEEERDGSDNQQTRHVTASVILPTTIEGTLPFSEQPLNMMCRSDGEEDGEEEEEDDEEEEDEDECDEEQRLQLQHREEEESDDEVKRRQHHLQDMSHLFLLPALAPWIGAGSSPVDQDGADRSPTPASFSFLSGSLEQERDAQNEEEDREEAEEEEEEEVQEDENGCQDLSCHHRSTTITPSSPSPMLYFDLDDRRVERSSSSPSSSCPSATKKRMQRRRRRSADTEEQQLQRQSDEDDNDGGAGAAVVQRCKRKSTDTPDDDEKQRRHHDDDTDRADDDATQRCSDGPIALLAAKRLKSDITTPTTVATTSAATPSNCRPQFYPSPHDTATEVAESRVSPYHNQQQQMEAENLSTNGSGHRKDETMVATAASPEQPEVESTSPPPSSSPSVESIDRITSLVSIFSFGNLASRTVVSPGAEFCAAQAQKDPTRHHHPDHHHHHHHGVVQHHGQRGYLTMTV